MIVVKIFSDIIGEPIAVKKSNGSVKLSSLVRLTKNRESFDDVGIIRVDGCVIDKSEWKNYRVTKRSDRDVVIDLVFVPGGKGALAAIASLAVIAATGFIASGGLAGMGFGSLFAKGAIGAYAASAAIGLGGQLAIGALTAPPKQNEVTQDGSPITSAGVDGNAVAQDGMLPVVLGKIGISPPHLFRPYQTFHNGSMTAHAVLGVQGRCKVERLLINGKPAADIPGLEYEMREGAEGEAARTIGTKTVIEQSDGIVLSNFKTKQTTVDYDKLEDQVTPSNSYSQKQYFKNDGVCNKTVFRLQAPQGFARTDGSSDVGVALRIRARRVGDATWRNLPTLHIYDKSRGISPLRLDISLIWDKPPTGVSYVSAVSQLPVFEICAVTGRGQTFEYQADSYFQPTVGYPIPELIPTMTGYTTNGVTLAASSENAGNQAWYARDNSSTTYWRSATSARFPHWFRADLGTAKTVRSYKIGVGHAGGTAQAPTAWSLQGSNDASNWTTIDTDTANGYLGYESIHQVQTPGSYRYYRALITANNGAAYDETWLDRFSLYETDAVGCFMPTGQLPAGGPATYNSLLQCAYSRATDDGAEFYLDPDRWPLGEYEFDVQRGWSFDAGQFTARPYALGGTNATLNPAFFEAVLVNGFYTVYSSPQQFRGDLQVETFQTISDEAPFVPDGIALIALKIPDQQIKSVYAEFTSYAQIVVNGSWTTEEFPTRNPAALFRKIITSKMTQKPIPDEIVKHDELLLWYQRCEASGHQANAICSGMTVSSGLQVVSSCGYATPRIANVATVVEDRDTRADPISQIISPINSRDTGTENSMPDLPDAVRVKFFDESKDYSERQITVYRSGKNQSNAAVFETMQYIGFTSEQKARARAEFDLKQLSARRIKFNREVGIEGYGMYRGQVVGLSDDTLDNAQAAGIVESVERSNGLVSSITIDNVMPWGDGSGGVEGTTGISIRLDDGTVLTKKVSNVTDSNVCHIDQPFDDNEKIQNGLLVVAGKWGSNGESVVRRCRVLSWVPISEDTFQVVLVEEAGEILFN